MKLKKYALVVSFIFSLTAFGKSYASNFHEQLNNMFFNVLADIQTRAKNSGDLEIAKLLQHPTVSIDWDSKLPGASATHGRGNASVEVSVEMIKLLYFFADLRSIGSKISVGNMERYHQCQIEYSSHIRNQVAAIFEGKTLSSEFSTYDAPEEFAKFSHFCKGIEKHLPVSGTQNDFRNQLVGNAIAFIVMHEIGHIVQKHRLSVKPTEVRRSMLCASRTNEKESDEFAVRKLVSYGAPAAVHTNSYWDLGVSVGSIFPSSEARSTHPSPSRRMVESIELSIKQGRRLGIKMDPRWLDVLDQLIELQSRIDSELADEKDYVISNVKC